MTRMLLLLLVAMLVVMTAVTAALANGTSRSESAAPTTEEVTPAPAAPALPEQPSVAPQPQAMAQPGVACPPGVGLQPGMVGQYGAGALAACPTANSAIALEKNDVYAVAGGTIYKFDRDLNVVAQAPLAAGMMAGLQPGQMAPYGAVGGPSAGANPSIAIRRNDVYVVAGGSIYKFDRNLNPVRQAALPSFYTGTSLAMLPGQFPQYGYYNQFGQYVAPGTMAPGVSGRVAQAPPYMAPSVTPSVTQPGVAGFREQPAQPQRWMANLSGTPLQLRTNATGTGEFWLSNQGQTLNYRLNVRNLRNVTGAQLRLLQPGVSVANAPVVAHLFSPRRATGAVSGRLAAGAITARDLMGPFRGQALSSLVTAMNQGKVMVDIFTSRNPHGEIAGPVTVSAR